MFLCLSRLPRRGGGVGKTINKGRTTTTTTTEEITLEEKLAPYHTRVKNLGFNSASFRVDPDIFKKAQKCGEALKIDDMPKNFIETIVGQMEPKKLGELIAKIGALSRVQENTIAPLADIIFPEMHSLDELAEEVERAKIFVRLQFSMLFVSAYFRGGRFAYSEFATYAKDLLKVHELTARVANM
jgi:hypothetical protein